MSVPSSQDTPAVFVPKPDRPPPGTSVGIVGWLRENLFSSPTNIVLTILAVLLIYLIVPPLFSWVLYDAHFVGDGREACRPNINIEKDPVVLDGRKIDGTPIKVETTADRIVVPEGVEPNVRWSRSVTHKTVKIDRKTLATVAVEEDKVIVGACWVFIATRWDQFIYGFYPDESRWRANLAIGLGLIGLIYCLTERMPGRRWVALALIVPYPVLVFFLLLGGTAGGSYLGFSDGGGTRFWTAAIALACALFWFAARGQPVRWWVVAAAFILPILVPTGFANLLPMLGIGAEAVATGLGTILSLVLLAGLGATIVLAVDRSRGRDPTVRRLLIAAIAPIPIYLLLIGVGDAADLEHIETNKWGGLLLTFVIAGVGIVGSLPIGIALALGRRSQMVVIRLLCIVFIEFVRAVPLITILFMASVILPLFLPPGSNFDVLMRALIGVTLFSAAYMAETVRGGLQAIPKGQYEAAQAMGMGYWQMMGLIVLPQALKIVIPAIVSSFIGLFKDTTLVLIIGLTDTLAMVQLAVTDAKWIGLAAEGYFFAAFCFFVFCFAMSRYSMYLERKLDTSHRT